MLVITATTRKGSCGHSRSSKYAQEAFFRLSAFGKQDSTTLKDKKVLMFEAREDGALLRMNIVIGVFDIAKCHIIWQGHMTHNHAPSLRSL